MPWTLIGSVFFATQEDFSLCCDWVDWFFETYDGKTDRCVISYGKLFFAKKSELEFSLGNFATRL